MTDDPEKEKNFEFLACMTMNNETRSKVQPCKRP